MLLSINQLSELIGFDRRTITTRLKDLPVVDGEKGALLYESTAALPMLYKADNLEAARAKQALSQASLNAVREEDLRKQRIPRQLVIDAIDESFQAISATLKAAKGKKLTPERINELLDKLRLDPKTW
jgi:multidrug resistance efflux pump